MIERDEKVWVDLVESECFCCVKWSRVSIGKVWLVLYVFFF